jgi:hypothetical protein
VEDDVCRLGDGGGGGFIPLASSPPLPQNRDGASEVARYGTQEGGIDGAACSRFVKNGDRSGGDSKRK